MALTLGEGRPPAVSRGASARARRTQLREPSHRCTRSSPAIDWGSQNQALRAERRRQSSRAIRNARSRRPRSQRCFERRLPARGRGASARQELKPPANPGQFGAERRSGLRKSAAKRVLRSTSEATLALAHACGGRSSAPPPPCVDALWDARGVRIVRACDRLRTCVRPRAAALGTAAGRSWRCAGRVPIDAASAKLSGKPWFSRP